MQLLDWCAIRFTSRRCGLEPFVFSCAWPPEAHSVQGCTGQQMWVWYRAAMDNPFLKCLGGHIYGSWVRRLDAWATISAAGGWLSAGRRFFFVKSVFCCGICSSVTRTPGKQLWHIYLYFLFMFIEFCNTLFSVYLFICTNIAKTQLHEC